MGFIEEKQLIKLHTILKKLDIRDLKQDLLDTYADEGRYIFSSKRLTPKEGANIITYLLDAQKRNISNEALRNEVFYNKIMSCCMLMGWQKFGKPDLKRIDTWVKEHGELKQGLSAYTGDQLGYLAEKLLNLRDDYLSSIGK